MSRAARDGYTIKWDYYVMNRKAARFLDFANTSGICPLVSAGFAGKEVARGYAGGNYEPVKLKVFVRGMRSNFLPVLTFPQYHFP